MSQPSTPTGPPRFTPPASYGGYGGDLQNYPVSGRPSSPAPYADPPAPPRTGYPSPGYPQVGHAPLGHPQPGYPEHRPGIPQPPQRPGTVGLAATLAVTASLQWVCALGFVWLVTTAAVSELGTTGADGVLLHMMSRFGYRMVEGLAWPLFLFPLASTFFGFALLGRAWWSRIGFTVTGLVAVLWSLWWLHSSWLLWLPSTAYIAVACLLVWTPSASRWFARKPTARR